MTVSTQTNQVIYNGDGSAVNFPFNFPVFDSSHLFVYRQNISSGEIEHTYSSGEYTITGLNDENGGSVTLTSAPSSAYKIIVARIVPLQQDLDVDNQGGFYPDNFEHELDDMEMQIQQMNEELGRAIKVQRGDNIGPVPRPKQRANKVLGFDSLGEILLSTLTITTGTFTVFPNITLMKLGTFVDGQFALLGQELRFGLFQFLAQDFSAEVAADTTEAIYVALNGQNGSTGALRRVDRAAPSVGWFGADNTGQASSVVAFNAAIAYANAHTSGTTKSDYVGMTLRVPDGVYLLDNTLTTITGPGIQFMGQSRRGTILKITATGKVFTWGSTTSAFCYGGGLSLLTCRYSGTPANTAVLITISKGVDQTFEQCSLYNLNTAVQFGTDSTHIASATWLTDVEGFVYNSGKPTFDFRNGSACFMNNVAMFVDGVPVAAQDRVSQMITLDGTNAIEFTHGSWDGFWIDGGCNFNRYYHNVYVNAPGSVLSNFWLGDDTSFDYTAHDNLAFHAATNATGGIFHVNIGQCYIASWGGVGILFTGNNTNGQHDINGPIIYFAGTHGIQISGNATRDIKVRGARIYNPNRLVGDYSGITITDCLGFIDIDSCTVKADPTAVLSWSATFGISVVSDQVNYQVHHCTALGTSKNYNIAPDIALSTSRVVKDNLFADYEAGKGYAGLRTDGIFVMPASGNNWLNTSPWDVQVAFVGMNLGIGLDSIDLSRGDISGVVTDDLTWVVKPGHTVHVGYDGTGTTKMFFFVMP